MDGFLHPRLPDGPAPEPLYGVLFAEDFDAPEPAEPEIIGPDPAGKGLRGGMPADAVVIEPEPGPAEPLFTASELEVAQEEAREEGIALGRAREAHAREATARAALERIATALDGARLAAREIAEEAAEEVARLVLAMTACALPAFCAAHGEAELRAAIRSLLPALLAEPRAVLRVHPAHLAAMRQELAALAPEAEDRIQVVAAEGMSPGDFRAAWEGGSAARSLGAIRDALRAALEPLGLTLPAEPAVPPAMTTRKESTHAG